MKMGLRGGHRDQTAPGAPASPSALGTQPRRAEVLAGAGEGAEQEAREPWDPRRCAFPDPT